MLLNLSDISLEPLHAQISQQIRAKILAGELTEGQALPSIRGLAKEQRVSVITVQRAYEDLDREGLIVSKRGKGFYVSSLTNEKKRKIALDRLREKVQPVLSDALASGLDSQEIQLLITKLLKSGGVK
jgi:GntR family transcriptional regulator